MVSDADPSRVDAVIAGFYEAAADAVPWSEVLGRVGELFGSLGGQLGVWDAREGRVVFSAVGGQLAPEARQAYDAHYAAIDPIAAKVAALPVGATFACHEYFTPEFVRSDPFYNEYLLPHGYCYTAATRLLAADGMAGALGLTRSAAQGPFEADDIALLRRLSPHLGRALRFSPRLASPRTPDEALPAILGKLPGSAFIVDAAAHVLVMNDRARQLVGAGDGLKVRSGALVPSQVREAVAFLLLVSQAAQAREARGGGMRLSRPGGRRPHVADVTPLPASASLTALWQRPAALVLITDPGERPAPLGRRLKELFRLTDAEAQLAVGLAEGRRLDELAERGRVSRNTVKSQLRAVLSKTETRGQADLVGLLARLPPRD